MNCASCGKILKPNTRFCNECGTPVSVTQSDAAAPPVEAAPKVCATCGNMLKPNTRFCNGCGASVAVQNAPAPAAPAKRFMQAGPANAAPGRTVPAVDVVPPYADSTPQVEPVPAKYAALVEEPAKSSVIESALPLAPVAAFPLDERFQAETSAEPTGQADTSDAKSKIVAGLLAFFFGTLGIHNFYLGYTSKAVTQLILALVGYPLIALFGLGLIIVIPLQIWAFIEMILILVGNIKVDGHGRRLS